MLNFPSEPLVKIVSKMFPIPLASPDVVSANMTFLVPPYCLRYYIKHHLSFDIYHHDSYYHKAIEKANGN